MRCWVFESENAQWMLEVNLCLASTYFQVNLSQGKLIEIHFSGTGKISGAKIQTCKLAYSVLSMIFLSFYLLLLIRGWPIILFCPSTQCLLWLVTVLLEKVFLLSHALYIGSSFFLTEIFIHNQLIKQSRVVQCTEGERSYHSFYQLCAGAPPALRGISCLKFIVLIFLLPNS